MHACPALGQLSAPAWSACAAPLGFWGLSPPLCLLFSPAAACKCSSSSLQAPGKRQAGDTTQDSMQSPAASGTTVPQSSSLKHCGPSPAVAHCPTPGMPSLMQPRTPSCTGTGMPATLKNRMNGMDTASLFVMKLWTTQPKLRTWPYHHLHQTWVPTS
jgi:hypothetical protein